ncbi:hypothetical protein LOAG_01632 [Loa loa]|uniref:Uncharacterized protein n=1 Tax=Loa loa TaxID=7209 RepID=A0A1S0UAF6_LOALO|nr:hypothetical protein LOAG_01632 [Loa loa]EFO26850.1 hypothetical protein LOAG_01632 [Loa loa]
MLANVGKLFGRPVEKYDLDSVFVAANPCLMEADRKGNDFPVGANRQQNKAKTRLRRERLRGCRLKRLSDKRITSWCSGVIVDKTWWTTYNRFIYLLSGLAISCTDIGETLPIYHIQENPVKIQRPNVNVRSIPMTTFFEEFFTTINQCVTIIPDDPLRSENI